MSGLRTACCFVSVVFALGACGPSSGAGDAGEISGSLIVSPAEAELVIQDGVVQSQDFTVQLRSGEEMVDVSDRVTWSLDNSTIGSFEVSTFSTATLAGKSVAWASLDSAMGSANITVRVVRDQLAEGVPEEAPSWFEQASDDAALAAQIVYPEDGTLVPPNLGDFEAHWAPAAGTDLYRMNVRSELVSISVYTFGQPGTGGLWDALSHADFRDLGISALGDELTVEVSSLRMETPDKAGTSAPILVSVSEQDVNGGLYYWASSGTQAGGIYRHDMAHPKEPAEAFYTTNETPDSRCVACHVISRAGDRMAVTYDGGNGNAAILDVASRQPMTDTTSLQWNFASFTADGSKLLTVHQGQMKLRDANTAAVIKPVTATGWPTQPDFSPRGDSLVYVRATAPGSDWTFGGGELVTRSYDMATDEFGPETLLIEDPNANLYYPSFSPDGDWIIFSRSIEDAYDDASAELYAIKADGSGSQILLASPNNTVGLTNSWARWAPFQQMAGIGKSDPEPLFWFTFSSKRAFGVRLPQGQPQLWMAPFYPQRMDNGNGSAPAFRLPFQSIETNNHIAQWTEEVVPIN